MYVIISTMNNMYTFFFSYLTGFALLSSRLDPHLFMFLFLSSFRVSFNFLFLSFFLSVCLGLPSR